MEDLGAFLRAKGVRPSAADEGTLPEVVTEINERLMAAMHNCMQALNLGGLKLQSLIDAVNTRCRCLPGPRTACRELGPPAVQFAACHHLP